MAADGKLHNVTVSMQIAASYDQCESSHNKFVHCNITVRCVKKSKDKNGDEQVNYFLLKISKISRIHVILPSLKEDKFVSGS